MKQQRWTQIKFNTNLPDDTRIDTITSCFISILLSPQAIFRDKKDNKNEDLFCPLSLNVFASGQDKNVIYILELANN